MRPRPGFLSVLPLYLAMALALGFVDQYVRGRASEAFTKHVPAVMAGQAEPPARYRVLAPAIYDWMTRATGSQPENSWLVFRFLGLLAAFAAGHLLYRTWFSTGGAVAGNALVAALLPLTFTNPAGHPDTFTELLLFTFGCACALRRWHLPFLVTLALATLNRETAFLLVLVYAGIERPSAAGLRRIAVAAILWGVICAGLRSKLGYASYEAWQFGNNLTRLFHWPVEAWQRDLFYRAYGWFFVVMLAGPVILIARTWAAQPRFVRVGVGIVVPLFVAIGVMFSSVMEPRIFTPLLPLVATGTLFALFEPEAKS